MSNLDIKQKIDFNNRQIEQMFTPNMFLLNNTVSELLAENARLQKQCTHQFEDGYCNYCYVAEGDVVDG